MIGTTKPPRTFREDVDELRRLVRKSVAFWRRTISVLVVAAIATVALVVRTPPIYRSETLILYQEAIRSSDLTGGEAGGENARRVGARLREALLSRASLEPIVIDLHLFAKPDADRHDLIDAVDEMRSRIAFKAREGDTFAIAFDGNAPEQTQEVTRRLADRIVQYAAARRADHARTLKEFLDAESHRNEASLKTRESAFAQFLAAHPEFALTTTTDMHVPRKPSALQAAADPGVIALEIRAARIEEHLKPAPAPGSSAVPAPLPDDPEVVAARKDLADKLLRYTDKHPDVTDARVRLRAAEATQARARAEAATQAAAAREVAPAGVDALDERQREILAQRLAALRAQIASTRASKAATAGAPSTLKTGTEDVGAVATEVEFRRLQREVNEARERQRQLDDKQFKASITASLVADDRNIQVSVLDPAYLPTHPISKSRRLIALAGVLIGVFLAFLTGMVSARLDDRLYDGADVMGLDILPVLGEIPHPIALPPLADASAEPDPVMEEGAA